MYDFSVTKQSGTLYTDARRSVESYLEIAIKLSLSIVSEFDTLFSLGRPDHHTAKGAL